MSYDLWVWAGPAYTAGAIREPIRLFLEANDKLVFDASLELPLLVDSNTSRFPALEVLPENQVESSPWSIGPERSDRAVSFCTIRIAVGLTAGVIVKEAFDWGLLHVRPTGRHDLSTEVGERQRCGR